MKTTFRTVLLSIIAIAAFWMLRLDMSVGPTTAADATTPPPSPPKGMIDSDAWRGLPLIKGRVHEFPDEKHLTYCVLIPVLEAESFYKTRMSTLGWTLGKRSLIDSTEIPGGAVMLRFTNKAGFVAVTIARNAQEQHTTIVLMYP